MKVLITGATGLVGSKLVDACLSKGYSVNYLTTSQSKLKKEGVLQGFYWNLKTKEIETEAFKDVDVIINLAGAPIAERWTRSYKQEIISSRKDTLDLLKTTISENNINIKHLISASAIGIYPDSYSTYYSEDNKSTEDAFVIDVVRHWEAAADQFEGLKIPVAKVRIRIVLSSKGGALPKLVKPIKNYLGSPIGNGKQWQSWIHIDDLVNLFLFVLDKQLEGVFNAVAPNPVMQSALTRSIAETLKKPLWLPNVPAFVLKLLLGEMSYIVLTGQRVSSEKIQDLGFEFKYHQVAQALNDLLGN